MFQVARRPAAVFTATAVVRVVRVVFTKVAVRKVRVVAGLADITVPVERAVTTPLLPVLRVLAEAEAVEISLTAQVAASVFSA